jgi:actin-like ATPase involved in cell morphogenesis
MKVSIISNNKPPIRKLCIFLQLHFNFLARKFTITNCERVLPMMFNIRSFVKTFLGNLLGFLSNDIVIDLGTANTLVFVRDKGIVLSKAIIVEICATSMRASDVGNETKKMLGLTPGSITTLCQMRDRMIADSEVLEAICCTL